MFYSDNSVDQAHLAEIRKFKKAAQNGESAQHNHQQANCEIISLCVGCIRECSARSEDKYNPVVACVLRQAK